MKMRSDRNQQQYNALSIMTCKQILFLPFRYRIGEKFRGLNIVKMGENYSRNCEHDDDQLFKSFHLICNPRAALFYHLLLLDEVCTVPHSVQCIVLYVTEGI